MKTIKIMLALAVALYGIEFLFHHFGPWWLVGNVALFIAASFAQFSRSSGAMSTAVFIVSLVAGVWFLGWWSLITLLAGGINGSFMLINLSKRNSV